MQVFSRLLNIGVTNDLEFYQKKEVRILNILACITLMGTLFGTLNIAFIHEPFPIYSIFFECIVGLLILFFNYKKLYVFPPFLFVISVNLTLLYLNMHYGLSCGCYLYYFPLIFCIALLHNPNRSTLRSKFFFITVIVGFVLSATVKIPFIKNNTLTYDQCLILFTFNCYFSVIITTFLVFLIVNFINKQYKELNALISKGQDDKIIINSALNEKDILLAEIQHRVKNNLAVIIGLFNLQKEGADNEKVKESLNEAKNRVLSIAMVHERLYKKSDLSKINLKNYISELTKEIVFSHSLSDKILVLEELENIEVDITKAVPIGLIINEAITNSLKHAFSDSQIEPTIKVSLATNFDLVNIKMHDNGRGFTNTKRSDKSLGLTLIESLADQIDGNIHYSNGNGTTVKLSFPITR